MRTQTVSEHCREWSDGKLNYCAEPAVVILWGKLFDPEALGPRCEEHARKHLGMHVSDALRQSYAIFDLRGLRRT